MCTEIIEKSFEDCDHKRNIECHQKYSCVCEVDVSKKLKCGHSVVTECSKKPNNINCFNIVNTQLKCGHFKDTPCYSLQQYEEKVKRSIISEEQLQDEFFQCENIVEKCYIGCGHTITYKCSKKGLFKLCIEMVSKKLKCGHICRVECYKNPIDTKCVELVDLQLDCGHTIQIECHEKKFNNSRKFCDKVVRKRIQKCGHFVNIPCYHDTSTVSCNHYSHKDRHQYHRTDETDKRFSRTYINNQENYNRNNNYHSDNIRSLKDYYNSNSEGRNEDYDREKRDYKQQNSQYSMARLTRKK